MINLKHTKEYLERRAQRKKAQRRVFLVKVLKRFLPWLVVIPLTAIPFHFLNSYMGPIANIIKSKTDIGKCVSYEEVSVHKSWVLVITLESGNAFYVSNHIVDDMEYNEFQNSVSNGKTFVVKYLSPEKYGGSLACEITDTDGFVYLTPNDVNSNTIPTLVFMWVIYGFSVMGCLFLKWLSICDEIKKQAVVDNKE